MPGARLAIAVGIALLASACSSPLTVPAAPHAADPRCAEIVLALPDDLDGMPRIGTGSQATVAWGDRDAPVVLRCGVEVPPPTTDPCVTVDDGLVSVDWLAVEAAPEAPGPDDPAAGDWTFTTFGREPAVEVLVPAEVAATRSTSFLVDLGPAMARVVQTRACQ